MTREPIVPQKPTYPPDITWHDTAKSISPKPVRLARTHSKFRFCHTASQAKGTQMALSTGTTTACDLQTPLIAFLASFSSPPRIATNIASVLKPLNVACMNIAAIRLPVR